jgi:FemAB-related protein (PEP-CTERM system-associated)
MKIENVIHPGQEWDEFAEAQPGATLGHSSAWAAIYRQSYGLDSRYLCCREANDRVAGVLPLVVFRGRPGGQPRLVSLPFLDSAGILASNAEATDALLAAVTELCRRERFSGFELRRNAGFVDGAEASGGMDRVNLVLELEADAETQWEKLRAKVRNQCRKADREGLVLAGPDDSALLSDFYGVFEINMRDLGSPVHSLAFFEAMSAAFRERIRFIVTRLEDRPVGGLVAIRYGQRVYVPWASTLRAERSRCPNNQIYWEAIRWAIEVGAKGLDFGRSPIDGGTYRFKKGWDARQEILDWRRLQPDGQSIPANAGTDNAMLKRLSQLWTRLPVPVASALGSRIRHYFAN